MARRSAFVILAGAIACSGFPASVSAQAWVPARGEGSVSILFQDLFVENHLTAIGDKQALGEIHSNSLIADVSYGLTDRLALTLAVPYIRTRYSGRARHPGAMDDGTPHSAFQDVRFGARFNVLDGPVTITPFVGTSVPSHSYEYFAHAAYGPRVRELEVGAYVGRIVPVGPRPAFVQARYAYGFLEEIAGIERNRSSLDVEVGYFFSPRVRAFVMGAGQKTHGGVDLPTAGWRAMPQDLQEHHDRISRVDILDFGGGVQVLGHAVGRDLRVLHADDRRRERARALAGSHRRGVLELRARRPIPRRVGRQEDREDEGVDRARDDPLPLPEVIPPGLRAHPTAKLPFEHHRTVRTSPLPTEYPRPLGIASCVEFRLTSGIQTLRRIPSGGPEHSWASLSSRGREGRAVHVRESLRAHESAGEHKPRFE